MKILLGSKNPNKKLALIKALEELNIKDFKIITFNVDSNVSSKPINADIIKGADNRNKHLRAIAVDKGIEYDYLCSIEGGFELDDNNLPFIVTYCIIEDELGKKSTGKSLGLRITKTMYNYVLGGGSLNKVIEDLSNIKDNKQSQGITGYLSNGIFNRSEIDKDAVISSFISFIFKENKILLDKHIDYFKNYNT